MRRDTIRLLIAWTALLVATAILVSAVRAQPALVDSLLAGESLECCRICTTSQPCGNGCISKDWTCRQPPGCACAPGETPEGSRPVLLDSIRTMEGGWQRWASGPDTLTLAIGRDTLWQLRQPDAITTKLPRETLSLPRTVVEAHEADRHLFDWLDVWKGAERWVRTGAQIQDSAEGIMLDWHEGDDPDLTWLDLGGESLMIDVRFTVDSYDAPWQRLVWKISPEQPRHIWTIEIEAAQQRIWFRLRTEGGLSSVSAAAPAIGVETDVQASYDGQQMRLSIGGVLMTSGSKTGEIHVDAQAPGRIGVDGTNPFAGTIHSVRINR